MPPNTLQAVWHFISATPTLVPLLLLPLAGFAVSRAWQSLPGPSQFAWWAALAVLLFGALDWGLLTALPRLDLSFGPAGLPLLGITGVRFAVTLALIWLWQWLGARGMTTTSSPGIIIGLLLLWLLHLGITACEIQGLYFEPFNLRVTTLSLPGPESLTDTPLRIVQLSDMHVERTTKREREVLATVQSLNPDIIVLTGDYLNTSYIDDATARHDAHWFFAQLKATYGVYAVPAQPGDTPDAMAAMFDGLDITVLHDEVQHLDVNGSELYLIGISYLDRRRDREVLPQLMQQLPEDAYSLLLYHTPDMIEVASAENVDLYLAGHTHGGQIRLPLYGAIITASAFGKQYEQGRYTVGDTTLHVSRGIGMEGQGAPRARFLCPPEIIVVDLMATSAE